MSHLPARISHYTPIHTPSSTSHGGSMSVGAIVIVIAVLVVIAVIAACVKAARR